MAIEGNLEYYILINIEKYRSEFTHFKLLAKKN
jgi:hypothetical protein